MRDHKTGKDSDKGVDDSEDRNKPCWADGVNGVIEGPVSRPTGGEMSGIGNQSGSHHLNPEQDGEQTNKGQGGYADGTAPTTGFLVQGGNGVKPQVTQRRNRDGGSYRSP